MPQNKNILVINPGSTSTRTAIFCDGECVAEQYLQCSREEIDACANVAEQVPMRAGQVSDFIAARSMKPGDFVAIAARGGPLRPVPGGVYRVNQAMLDDAVSDRFVEHVSKIACVIADQLAADADIPAFIVDPVSTDEYDPISRISGLKELPRKSLVHALNLKAVARVYAQGKGRAYQELNLITAQLGGGISIAVHKQGRMVDSVDANGEGPFSPERSGGLRVDSLARMVLDSGRDFSAIRAMLTRQGGLLSHLGTTDAREVIARMDNGDEEAGLVFRAMAYNIAKHICALSATVNGRVDAVILTGGLANARPLVDMVSERVGFLGEVVAIPGEHEMEALAAGVRRVLCGEEKPREYPGGEIA